MENYHQISAFVTAKERNGKCLVAYSVYDTGEELVERFASIDGITEHRGLLMAAWSVLHYVIGNGLSVYDLSVYSDNKEVCDELTGIWYGDDISKHEDADRVEKVISDCCRVASVAFSVCDPYFGESKTDYHYRMAKLRAKISSDYKLHVKDI